MVEDESRMAGLLKRALQEEGHAVDVAADGQEGLWLATENAYGAIVAAAGVTGRVDVPPGTCADVDPDRILQAVDNLVGNALRFAPQGSVIVLAARAAGGDLEIEVSDDGPGFPVGFLPHAFERFARPDSGRSRDDGGAGLGLAIVRAIAVAHGGVAVVANKPGGGAVVTLRLPGVAGPA